jgi:glycosyltransferase involved in cell wall biosynthesis
VMGEADHETVLEEDVRRFQAAHSLGGKRVILYTGTLEPYQGVDLLVASAEHVTRKRDDVMFLLVGGTPKQVHHYGKLAKERGLSSHFRFMGRRPMSEMPRFIRSASILVSPRIDGVNTPSKLYSYLKSGKPIVATNILAHTQVLTGDIAVLAEPSPASFADGILRLLEDQQFADQISLRARQVAQEKYGTQDFIEKTQWMLDRLLSGGERG